MAITYGGSAYGSGGGGGGFSASSSATWTWVSGPTSPTSTSPLLTYNGSVVVANTYSSPYTPYSQEHYANVLAQHVVDAKTGFLPSGFYSLDSMGIQFFIANLQAALEAYLVHPAQAPHALKAVRQVLAAVREKAGA